jgi:carboxylesterase type B
MLRQIIFAQAKRSIKDAFLFAKTKVNVKTNQGICKGCLESLPDGRKFIRFSGIPYAKKPINELKFKTPQKLLKFDSDELDCTRERDACFHKSTIKRKFIGSEDCLNLNVYAPADYDSSSKKAVMVFIHGGGFMMDSNSVDL